MPISNNQRARMAVRDDDRDAASGRVVAYRTEDAKILDWQGEEDAPWVRVLGGANGSDTLLIEDNPSSTSENALTRYTTGAVLENSAVIKTTEGRLYMVHATLTSGINADRFLHVLDQDTVPGGGPIELPIWRVHIPPTTNYVLVAVDFPRGLYFADGCVVAISTTLLNYTAPAALEGSFCVLYA